MEPHLPVYDPYLAIRTSEENKNPVSHKETGQLKINPSNHLTPPNSYQQLTPIAENRTKKISSDASNQSYKMDRVSAKTLKDRYQPYPHSTHFNQNQPISRTSQKETISHRSISNSELIDYFISLLSNSKLIFLEKHAYHEIIKYNKKISSVLKSEDKNKLDQVKGYLVEMEKKGFKPTAVTCNILINFYANQKKPEKAWTIFNFMQNSNDKYLLPDIRNSCCLVKSYCEIDHEPYVRKIWDYLNQEKIKPDLQFYTCLIKFYINLYYYKKTDWKWTYDNVIGITQNLLKQEIKINKIFCEIYLNFLLEIRATDDIVELVERAYLDRVEISEKIYSNTILNCDWTNKLDKLLIFFKHIQDSQITLYEAANQKFFQICTAAKDINTALIGLSYILMNPNKKSYLKIFTTLFELCSNTKNSRLTTYLLHVVEEKKLSFDVIAYNALMNICVELEDNVGVKEIYENMLKHRVCLTDVTYAILIKCFIQKKDKEKVLEFYYKALNEKIRLTRHCRTILTKFFLEQRDYKAVLHVLKYMGKNRLEFDYNDRYQFKKSINLISDVESRSDLIYYLDKL